jgi:integrase/recombinase XerD
MKTTYNTYKVIIRRDAVKKDGTAALALKVRIQGEVRVLPLNIAVEVRQFDDDAQRVSLPDKKLSEKINTIIAQARHKAQQIILDAIIAQRDLCIVTFLEQYNGARNQGSFITFFERSMKDAEGVKAPATIKCYRTSLKNMTDYKKEVRFSDLTPDFVEGLDRQLIRKGFDTNYVTRTHKLIKAVINQAIERKLIRESPYQNFKFKHAKTEREFLNMPELQRLIDLYQANTLRPDAQEVLRYFLFAAVAGGLRLGDVKELAWEEIVGDWLVFRPNKTTKSRTVLKVPLSKLAVSIINAVPKKGERVFSCKADAVTNRLLKFIQAEAKIAQRLTFHVSRHTFATVYLAMGGSVHVLQKIMGHSKIETTMIYVHVQHEQKIVDMARFDAAFGQISAITADM